MWAIIAVVYLSLFVLGISDNVRSPLFPEILNHYQIHYFKGSLFFSVASLFGILGSVSTHYFFHVMRVWNVLRLSLVLLFLGLLGLGLAPSWECLIMASAVFGAALGMLGVSQNLLILEIADPTNLQRLTSGLHSMYGLSSLIAPFVVTVVMGAFASVGGSFLVCAMLAVGLLVVTFFVSPPNESLAAKARSYSLKEYGYAIYFGIMLGSYVAAELLVSTRLALYLRTIQGFDLASSSIYLTLFFVGMFAGRLLFTFVKMNHHLRSQILIALAFSILFSGLGIVWDAKFFILTGFAVASIYPNCMAYFKQVHPQLLKVGTTAGLMCSSVAIVGMHSLAGWISDVISVQASMWVGPAAFALCAVLMLLYPKWGIQKT